MGKITFKMCRSNPMLRAKAAGLIRQKRLDVGKEHYSLKPDDLEMLQAMKYVSKRTFDDQGIYLPTHESIMNSVFEEIKLSEQNSFADIGGGTWTPALIAAHHVKGKVKMIEIDEEAFGIGKRIHKALLSSMPALKRVQAVCGNYLNFKRSLLSGIDVVYHACNVTGDFTKSLSQKIIDEMDVGALLILGAYNSINFSIDHDRLKEVRPEMVIKDKESPPFANMWSFQFFKKIQ